MTTKKSNLKSGGSGLNNKTIIIKEESNVTFYILISIIVALVISIGYYIYSNFYSVESFETKHNIKIKTDDDIKDLLLNENKEEIKDFSNADMNSLITFN